MVLPDALFYRLDLFLWHVVLLLNFLHCNSNVGPGAMPLPFVAATLRAGAGGESLERRAADKQPERGRFTEQLPPPFLQNRNRWSSGMRSHVCSIA